MSSFLTLVALPGDLDETIVAETRAALNAAGASTDAIDWLSDARAAQIGFNGIGDQRAEDIANTVLADRPIDVVALAAEGRRKRLLIADMDSTILANETLDEIAAEAGIGDEVAAITARSMRGELNFEDSLRERVALLEGRDASIIDQVLETISINPGAHAFVATMRASGAFTALISGGFTMFTDKVRDEVGFHMARANTFDIENGNLTGKVVGPIVGRETKLEVLNALSAEHGVALSEALTIGDGANDMAMIEAAGLGIAYFGKPVLREAARAQINHTDLLTALYFQGFRDSEIVER